MILKDMLNRIDENTNVIIFDNNGIEISRYDGRNSIDEIYNDEEVIFPISVVDNWLTLWIDYDREVVE